MLLCPDGELRVLAQCTFASVYICRNPLAQTAYSSFMHAHDDDDDDDDEDADADDDDGDDDDDDDDFCMETLCFRSISNGGSPSLSGVIADHLLRCRLSHFCCQRLYSVICSRIQD